jgi:hypothetical protein
MPLPEKYQDPVNMLIELREHGASLEKKVTWMKFNAFALAAYHLCEWIESDPAATKAAVADVRVLKSSLQIQACRDAANRYKHKKITRYSPTTERTDVKEAGWGIGGFGKGGHGQGEEEVLLSMRGGGNFNALRLSQEVVEMWNEFFRKHYSVQ